MCVHSSDTPKLILMAMLFNSEKLLFNRKTRYNYTLCSTVWKMSHLSLLGWKTQTTPQTTAAPLARKQEQGIWPPVVFFENLYMHSSSCHLIGGSTGDTHHSQPLRFKWHLVVIAAFVNLRSTNEKKKSSLLSKTSTTCLKTMERVCFLPTYQTCK